MATEADISLLRARARPGRTSRLLGLALARAVWYLVVGGAAVLFLVPFIWMLSTSLKEPSQIFVFPPEWIPRPFVPQNYVIAWKAFPTLGFFKNTVIVTLSAILGTLISSSLVAFGFARLRFRGRDILFLVLLATMMLPWHVTLIPLYLIFNKLKWINTLKPLIVPEFFASPFYVFLLRQFFMTIPLDMDDAAKIDGCGFFAIYWRILLPLAKPALGVIAMFSFTSGWNEFTRPLIYLNTLDKMTIAVGLRAFQSQLGIQRMQDLMAVSVMSIIPILIVFFAGQTYFVAGITMTGMK